MRFRGGDKVSVAGDVPAGAFGRQTLEPIPDGEVVTVFEDYGQTHVNVMRDNGQLRTVKRESLSTGPAYDGRCRHCWQGEPHTLDEHSQGVQAHTDVEKEAHSTAAGAKCHEGVDGCCLMCGVEMSSCEACHGVGYHRAGCPVDNEVSQQPNPPSETANG